uniref:Uncharacterized protein n=1 Tax=Poecilia reticulata TaxID=8081 RepID=A0A3P9P8K7_POERE
LQPVFYSGCFHLTLRSPQTHLSYLKSPGASPSSWLYAVSFFGVLQSHGLLLFLLERGRRCAPLQSAGDRQAGWWPPPSRNHTA